MGIIFVEDKSGMSLKNYYAMLSVPQSATGDQIRDAYRALAKKYHPDAAPDNPFAAAHFTEIAAAYEVLSNAARRTAYDEERWLRGLSNRSNTAIRITPEWLLGEAHRLRNHMKTVDTYRMSHAALRDYIIALLSDEHMSVLQGADHIQEQILEVVLESAARIRHEYTGTIAQRLRLLTGVGLAEQQQITEWVAGRSREARWNLYRPIIVLAFAVLMTLLIWLLK